MVNCESCKKSFRLGFGKTKTTRCESCAKFWRQQEALLQQVEKDKREKENELQLKEVELREKMLDLERQKVTIKETSTAGAVLELTCYYDQNMRHKISELLSGTRRPLPSPPSSTPTQQQKRRLPFQPSYSKSPSDDHEYRRARKLPSIDGLIKSRIAQRYKLEEDLGSSAGSGMSVD